MLNLKSCVRVPLLGVNNKKRSKFFQFFTHPLSTPGQKQIKSLNSLLNFNRGCTSYHKI